MGEPSKSWTEIVNRAVERGILRFDCIFLYGLEGAAAFDQALKEGAEPLAPRILEILHGA